MIIIRTELETVRFDPAKIQIVDYDGLGLRAYAGARVVAEKPADQWVTSVGEYVGDEAASLFDSLPVEKMKVRSGVKPMPPGTYWDDALGHYVEPTDEEWAEAKYTQALTARRRES